LPVPPHHRPAVRRLLRLLPLAPAAYALHSLIGSAAQLGATLHWLQAVNLGSATPWLLLALAFGAGFLLRESTRGLLALLAVGALLGDTLATHAHALSGGVGSVGGGIGSAGWVEALALVLFAGALLPLVAVGAWSALGRCARVRGRPPLRPPARSEPPHSFTWSPAPAPLLAGWSDRGPPPAAALATL
jgi:hypothetical protein